MTAKTGSAEDPAALAAVPSYSSHSAGRTCTCMSTLYNEYTAVSRHI